MLLVMDTLAAEGLLRTPDWAALGLVSSIVGCFLIANAILFEHPRRLVDRYLSRSQGRLRSVREYIYNRVQTTLGFTFLLGGFGLQLFSRYGGVSMVEGARPLSMVWVGLIVVTAVALLLTGWFWSLLAFRRYVREYFLDNPPNLEGDPVLAREVGELFDIDPRDDDTVEDYTRRLRERAGLPPTRSPRRAVVREPLPGIEALAEAEEGA